MQKFSFFLQRFIFSCIYIVGLGFSTRQETGAPSLVLKAGFLVSMYFLMLSEGGGDTKEVFCLEGCAADEAAVDVLLREEFLCV